MAWEKYTKTGRGFKPKVSIWKRGQIGFNRGFVEKFDLQNYKFAILFFDRENWRIGVQFTNDNKEEGITKLKVRKTGAAISASGFLEYYNVQHDKTIKCDIEYDKKGKIFIIQLDQQKD